MAEVTAEFAKVLNQDKAAITQIAIFLPFLLNTIFSCPEDFPQVLIQPAMTPDDDAFGSFRTYNQRKTLSSEHDIESAYEPASYRSSSSIEDKNTASGYSNTQDYASGRYQNMSKDYRQERRFAPSRRYARISAPEPSDHAPSRPYASRSSAAPSYYGSHSKERESTRFEHQLGRYHERSTTYDQTPSPGGVTASRSGSRDYYGTYYTRRDAEDEEPPTHSENRQTTPEGSTNKIFEQSGTESFLTYSPSPSRLRFDEIPAHVTRRTDRSTRALPPPINDTSRSLYYSYAPSSSNSRVQTTEDGQDKPNTDEKYCEMHKPSPATRTSGWKHITSMWGQRSSQGESTSVGCVECAKYK